MEESLTAPRLASATARRHGISNQLLLAWRKAYREGRIGDALGLEFVPAQIVPEPVCLPVKVISPTGWRVQVSRDCDQDTLGRVVRLLEELR